MPELVPHDGVRRGRPGHGQHRGPRGAGRHARRRDPADLRRRRGGRRHGRRRRPADARRGREEDGRGVLQGGGRRADRAQRDAGHDNAAAPTEPGVFVAPSTVTVGQRRLRPRHLSSVRRSPWSASSSVACSDAGAEREAQLNAACSNERWLAVPTANRLAVMANALLDRLDQGPLLCAEGYLFELERRGYLQAGAFVPEVVLEHPEAVAALHREFVAAGSDVVEAFTYYAHREKLRIIGREDDLERMNRQALAIAAAGRSRERHAVRRRRLQHERFRGRRRPRRGARDVRRTGRLGGRGRRRLRHRRDVPVRRPRRCSRSTSIQRGRTAGSDHACGALRGHDPRGLDAGGRVPAPRRRGRRRRRPQLHPRPADDAADARARSSRAVDVPVAALPVPYRTTTRGADVPVAHAIPTPPCSPTADRSRWRSTRSPARATRSPASPARRSTPACSTSGCAAARRRTTSGRWPRRWAVGRRPAGTRPT